MWRLATVVSGLHGVGIVRRNARRHVRHGPAKVDVHHSAGIVEHQHRRACVLVDDCLGRHRDLDRLP
jgi:hypothetical protein